MIPTGAIERTGLRDRSGWRPGPWDAEPDRVAWKAHGFHCLALRNRAGAWCGYVAVPPGHPWFKQSYFDVPAEVHGDLTFADHCHGTEGEGICHTSAPGEADKVWWLGFDCNHAGDEAPGGGPNIMRIFLGDEPNGSGSEYRELSYVVAQVEGLAKQAEEAAVAQ